VNSSRFVAVIGAGPAGLLAAIVAAGRGASVILFERMVRPALKLQASGGGRCNLSNRLSHAEFMQAFGRQGRFVQPALDAFSSEDLCDFLKKQGVETFSPDGLHVFPKTQSADDVCQALLDECSRLHVEIRLGCTVDKLLVQHDMISGLEVSSEVLDCQHVVLATGGRGYPKLGGGDTGYSLVREWGHTIVPLLPADVPLVTSESWLCALAGVSVPGVHVRVVAKGSPKAGWTGDLLFTHKGLSGPVILALSGHISARLVQQKPVELLVNFLASMPDLDIKEQFVAWRSGQGVRQVSRLLSTFIPASLVTVLCRLAGVPTGCQMAKLPGAVEEKLVRYLTACPIGIKNTEGFTKAMVTRGGVRLKEVDPRTLQSRLIKGLYFAGEVLDLDAPCGGFNLQWAFSSGYLAGFHCYLV